MTSLEISLPENPSIWLEISVSFLSQLTSAGSGICLDNNHQEMQSLHNYIEPFFCFSCCNACIINPMESGQYCNIIIAGINRGIIFKIQQQRLRLMGKVNFCMNCLLHYKQVHLHIFHRQTPFAESYTKKVHFRESVHLPLPRSPPPGESGRVEDVETEVELQHAESLGLAGEREPDQVIQPVVDCPVKLVWLVASQHQHESGVQREKCVCVLCI